MIFYFRTVPVTASIVLQARVYSVGTDISLYCNVTGEPTPEVTWYKDNRPIEASRHVEIPGDEINCKLMERDINLKRISSR